MSNKSPDDLDEYDAIFDDAQTGSETYTKIEVSDAEVIDGHQALDAEIIDDNGFKKDNSESYEAEGADIEDGIFAPERRERLATKKSSSLMWAVSLLAFVGVGAVAYVANPDIVSKVTQNIGGVAGESTDVTVPTDIVAPEDATIDNSVQTAQTGDAASIENLPPVVDTTSTDVIVPDAPQEIPVDPQVALTDVTQIVPSPVDPAALVSPVSNDQTGVVTPTEPTPVEQATAAAVAALPPTTPDSLLTVTDTPIVAVTTDGPVAPDIIPEETVDVAPSVVPTPPIEAKSEPVTPASTDVVIAVDDKEPVDENVEDTVSATPVDAAMPAVAAPVADTVANSATVTAAQKTDIKDEPKEKAPVVVASKEEQKVLDDANLNKYFDSPSGKMLAGIPAPSMNPKKGSNESIIIVNKKGQKSVSKPPKSAGNIVIETTNLNNQMISANRAVKLGRYDAAKEMYDELYRLNPRDVQILSGRAILLQKMGLTDQAISAYEEVLRQSPDNADAIVNLSGLIRKEYPAVALNKLLDMHVNHPNNVYVTAQLGVAYADAGNYADALRYLGNAASMDPKNALHYYNMAVISEKASKPEQAMKYYEKALEVDTIYGEGHKTISKEKIYDRLAFIRGN